MALFYNFQKSVQRYENYFLILQLLGDLYNLPAFMLTSLIINTFEADCWFLGLYIKI